MKKRTKEILSGVLAISILLSMPAGIRAAEAAGEKWTGSAQPEALWELEPGTDSETRSKTNPEPESKVKSETRSKTDSELESEPETEIKSEMKSEPKSESKSELKSETNSESKSELKSETKSEPGTETRSEPESELESKTEVKSEPEPDSEPETEVRPETESESETEVRSETESETEPESEDQLKVESQTNPPNKAQIEQASDTADFPVTGNGLEEEWTERDRNSSLCDSDFYIEYSKNGQTRQYSYTEWLDYLESCRGWVCGEVAVRLSDTGKKYFDAIRMTAQDSESGKGRQTYTFWAENTDKNASTMDVENGTRTYTAGVDMESPALEEIHADSRCYEPTMTDTQQYFAEDFVLRGAFRDAVSGVGRIEYTADIRPEADAVWIKAEDVREAGDSVTDFCIELPDGCYPAIAVRAVDEAGNTSEAVPYVNDAGQYIKVVVDSAAPMLAFDVSAGGHPYSGENDNWTNKDVVIRVTNGREGGSDAGICQCEYAYVKIGEAVAEITDLAEKWTPLSVEDGLPAVLEITEDTNGFYLFRAVSKAGVETTKDAKLRILIQHQATAIKPVLVSGADETKRKNGWYNKQSGTPEIRFEYPDYDTGVLSGTYDAPITIHYQLARQDFVPGAPESDRLKATGGTERTAVIGVMSDQDVVVNAAGGKEFVLTRDDPGQHTVDFGGADGYYTLQYWTTDRAGNESEKQLYDYKIDCHEPTDLTLELDGSTFDVGKESEITYQRFYSDTISGSADAQYGISQKGSLTIQQVKKIGEWKGMDSGSPGSPDTVRISPDTRCFLYIRAEDGAGNVAEGWTNGIVVDSMAPRGPGDGELIVVPEGANEHGFFNRDIAVAIRVTDEPADGNCAALKRVTGAVGRDGSDTIAGQELFSFTKEAPTEDEIIAASGYEGTLLIDAAANESNEAYVEVTATDRSDNTRTSTQLLKIDVTKPEIDIDFDNKEALNGNYYRQGRTATVHVHEKNFDPGAVRVSVTKDGAVSEAELSDWTSDGSEHYAIFPLTEDGEYKITAHCADLADNLSEEVQTETFIIDCTIPQIAIDLSAGQTVQPAGKEYFNTGVEAVITVAERNFRAEDFAISMTPVSEKGIWVHAGDVHTLRIPVEADGVYHIECAYTDLAGNDAEAVSRDFIIDTTAPAVSIEGVRNGSANSGPVLPVIFVQDANIEMSDISVSVTTGIGDRVEAAMETVPVEGGDSTRYRMTLTDMTQKPDNIYDLRVSATDRAGNRTERVCRFSLNRTGSVYDLTALAHLMERQYNTYKALDNIEIVEMNIDTVEEFDLYVSRNGELGYRAEYTSTVSGSADIGYTYVYQIGRENFAREGVYRLTLYSRDRAGNEVSNVTDIHGNEITFVIDNTAPRVVIDGVEAGKMYDTQAQEVRVVVTDNFKLAEAELVLVNKDDEVLASWDYMELAGEDKLLNITIPQRAESVSLLYRVRDAAGNEAQTKRGDQEALSDFLVTTDKYIQFVSKTSNASAGSLMGLLKGVTGVAATGAVTAIARRRRRL